MSTYFSKKIKELVKSIRIEIVYSSNILPRNWQNIIVKSHWFKKVTKFFLPDPEFAALKKITFWKYK